LNGLMETKKLARDFEFNGIRLPDPDPTMSPEQVRDLYAATYPDLTTASITGPDATGDKLRYRFALAIGSKG